ncbi:Crp/Fnr family transcriptional regulator [Spirillospora sp. NPDC000708]|jgi:CRP-like cAMP-binding protein|uniref:cyclic nucleotide-binding domain-containing protein n=1 Tax=Actinomadura nitritigenes TaxID=134602 RepID=UPI003354EC98
MALATGELAREPFLSGMRGADLGRLATAARLTGFPAGRRLATEPEPAERFWIIRDGTIDLDSRLPGGGSVAVDTLGPGAVVGWSWMFPPYRWRFGAVASTPVEAVEFDGRLVRVLCAVDPSLGYELTRRFAEVMADRLQTARTRLLAPSPGTGRAEGRSMRS